MGKLHMGKEDMVLVNEALAECNRLTALLAEERRAVLASQADTLVSCSQQKQELTAILQAKVAALLHAGSKPAEFKDALRALQRDLLRNDEMIRFAHALRRKLLGVEVPTGYDQHGDAVVDSAAHLRVRM